MANQPTTLGMPPPPPRYPLVVFGPKANCTLDLCPVQMSVYGYRPSLAANYAFIACFGLACAIHLILGVRTRSWWFMGAMCSGCVVCIVGYVGRIMLFYNPWSFVGFMLQISERLLLLTASLNLFCPVCSWTDDDCKSTRRKRPSLLLRRYIRDAVQAVRYP